MGKILQFPTSVEPVWLQNGQKHHVAVEILDCDDPRRTRNSVQFDIQETAGWRALKGVTDQAVASGYRLRFVIKGRRKVQKFVAGTLGLVASGRIAI
jgi:hypothetical protein